MAVLKAVLYHNIASEETAFEKGLGVTTSPELFEQHIRYYQKNYDIVGLDTVLSGRLPKRPILITFDDCYRSVLDVAEQLLAPARIPAVFFINPSLVGGGISLDNMIAWAANMHGIARVLEALGRSGSDSPSVGALVADMLARCTAGERAEIRRRLEQAFPLTADELAGRAPMLTHADLPRLIELGVEIGNHTATHVHCGALSADEYQSELVDPKAALEALAGSPVRSFSVPYGHERDLPPAVYDVLRGSGHQAIFLVHARSNRVRPHPEVWYRVSFQQQGVGDMPKRLSFLPELRSLRYRLAR